MNAWSRSPLNPWRRRPLATLLPPPARVIEFVRREVGPNGTGRICGFCGATTYGQSDRCGACAARLVRVK